MQDWIYHYPTLETGILLRRYKRFFADIQLTSGEVITAHCPNTGPMTDVSTPGSLVQVSYSNNPKRKLPYTWEMIQVNDNQPTWVGINTGLPNRIVKLALEQQVIPELVDACSEIRCEVPYGKDLKSRIDFLLAGNPVNTVTQGELLVTPSDVSANLQYSTQLLCIESDRRPIYLEVKNTTWAEGTVALFPDTVTTRGQKHLRELMAVVPKARAVMLYFINRGDCTHFAPGDMGDPVYGQLLREAVVQGVEVLPCRFDVTPQGIRYLGLAELLLNRSVA